MAVSSITSLLTLEVEMEGWAEAEAAAASLESTLSDLEGGVDVGISFDAEPLPFEDMPDEIPVEMNVTETPEGKQILDGLNFLVLKEKFELVMDIIGTAWDFIGKAEAFLVEPFLDVEDAVARINAQTGTAIPDLDQMIRDLQAADLGESVDQIADVVIQAQQLGQPMQEAAEAALTFTHTWTEQDPTAVLETFSSLVATGLVPNLQAAADLMTVFFQQGGNVGGDALAVVNANAQSWADMGLSASEALSTLDSLQQGTGATATDAAKMLQTFDDALTAAAADPASEQANTLRLMGITNPKDAGEAIGAETIDGFAAAFTNLPSDKQDLISGLFFGKGGKKFTGAIENMTTQGGPFADFIGAAEKAATEIDNSLRGAIDDFVLEINTSIARLLSSEELDLPGKIADLKEAFQKAAETLAEGGSLGDALQIGFGIEGVDTALMNVERVFGNFVITLLEIVAAIQDPLGINDNDKATRAEISRLATQQLPFDIMVANPEELEAIFGQAAKRGVVNLGAGLTTALDELVAEGNFDKVKAILSEIVSDPTVSPEAGQILVDKYTAQIDAAIAAQKPPPETEGWWNRLKPPADLDFLEKGAESGGSKGGGWWANLAPPPETITAIDTASEAATTAMSEVDTAAAVSGGVATDWATSITDATVAVADSATLNLATAETAMVSLRDQAQAMDIDIAAAMTGNTVTASFEAVEESATSTMAGVIRAVQSVTPHILQLDALLKSVAAAVATVQQSVNTAVTSAGAGAGGGGGNTTNINVNNTTNVQSPAQAAATGYQLGAQIRGMA